MLKKQQQKCLKEVWAYSLVVESLPNKHKALDSIATIAKTKQRNFEEILDAKTLNFITMKNSDFTQRSY